MFRLDTPLLSGSVFYSELLYSKGVLEFGLFEGFGIDDVVDLKDDGEFEIFIPVI